LTSIQDIKILLLKWNLPSTEIPLNTMHKFYKKIFNDEHGKDEDNDDDNDDTDDDNDDDDDDDVDDDDDDDVIMFCFSGSAWTSHIGRSGSEKHEMELGSWNNPVRNTSQHTIYTLTARQSMFS